MSVWIFRDGESELCEPDALHYQLNAGWSVTDGEPEETSDVSEEEYRAMAKELGIKSWHIKNIDKLISEIEELTNGG